MRYTLIWCRQDVKTWQGTARHLEPSKAAVEKQKFKFQRRLHRLTTEFNTCVEASRRAQELSPAKQDEPPRRTLSEDQKEEVSDPSSS